MGSLEVRHSQDSKSLETLIEKMKRIKETGKEMWFYFKY